MNQCQMFAIQSAKTKGLSYAEATKMFPQAYERGMVYIDDCNTSNKCHCTHCARAEALGNMR